MVEFVIELSLSLWLIFRRFSLLKCICAAVIVAVNGGFMSLWRCITRRRSVTNFMAFYGSTTLALSTI